MEPGDRETMGNPKKIMGFGHVLSFFDHLPCSLLGHFLVMVWYFVG